MITATMGISIVRERRHEDGQRRRAQEITINSVLAQLERPASKLAFRIDPCRQAKHTLRNRTDNQSTNRLNFSTPKFTLQRLAVPRKGSPIAMPPKRRILCVDDQADMCSLITMILTDYEVVSAHSKAEALRIATGGLFDLYLLDYYLPDGTGLELCLLIRDFDASTPILFVTDMDDLSQQQIENVNAQGLIHKEDLPDGLLSAIQKVLTN